MVASIFLKRSTSSGLKRPPSTFATSSLTRLISACGRPGLRERARAGRRGAAARQELLRPLLAGLVDDRARVVAADLEVHLLQALVHFAERRLQIDHVCAAAVTRDARGARAARGRGKHRILTAALDPLIDLVHELLGLILGHDLAGLRARRWNERRGDRRHAQSDERRTVMIWRKVCSRCESADIALRNTTSARESDADSNSLDHGKADISGMVHRGSP